MYPNEPILTVCAPLIDAQLVETAILTQINHQSLIATKTNRIVQSAKGRMVADFGARRAHNVDAAVYGARAAYIGGCRAVRRKGGCHRRLRGHIQRAGRADVRDSGQRNYGS